MGFWNFFFGQPAKPSPADDYFEDQWFFRPSGKPIDLLINGQLDSPTQRQKDFFAQLEKDYLLVVAAVIPVIEDEFRNWKPNFKIGNFQQEFELVWLEIPACDQQPIAWEIAFETVHDLNHHIFISMCDYQPLHILIDG